MSSLRIGHQSRALDDGKSGQAARVQPASGEDGDFALRLDVAGSAGKADVSAPLGLPIDGRSKRPGKGEHGQEKADAAATALAVAGSLNPGTATLPVLPATDPGAAAPEQGGAVAPTKGAADVIVSFGDAAAWNGLPRAPGDAHAASPASGPGKPADPGAAMAADAASTGDGAAETGWRPLPLPLDQPLGSPEASAKPDTAKPETGFAAALPGAGGAAQRRAEIPPAATNLAPAIATPNADPTAAPAIWSPAEAKPPGDAGAAPDLSNGVTATLSGGVPPIAGDRSGTRGAADANTDLRDRFVIAASPNVAATLGSGVTPIAGERPRMDGFADATTDMRGRFAIAAGQADTNTAAVVPFDSPFAAAAPAGSSAAPAAGADSTSLTGASDQLADQVAGQLVRMVSIGPREMVMRLHPPELGDLTLRVAVSGRDVTAWFASPQPQVQSAISSALGQLQTDLGNAGYNLHGAWVGADAAGARQQRQSPGAPPLPAAAAARVLSPAASSAGSRPRTSGMSIYV